MSTLEMLINLIEEDIVPTLNMGDYEKWQLRAQLQELQERAEKERTDD